MQKKILLIEDDPQSLELAADLLEVQGYRVVPARTAQEALELAGIHLPDLVLLDLQLPGMDGLALARLLKQDPATQGIPVVAMTAYALPGDRERVLEAGCDGYIPKPIDTRQFVKLVADLLSFEAKGS